MYSKPCFFRAQNFLYGKSRLLFIILICAPLAGCYSTIQYYKRTEQFVGNEIEHGFNRALQCDGANKEMNYCKDYPPKNKITRPGEGAEQVDSLGVAGGKEISSNAETPWVPTEETAPPPLPVAAQPLPEEIEAEAIKKRAEAKKLEDAKKASDKKTKSKKSSKKIAPKKEQKTVTTPPVAIDPGAPQQLIPSARELEETP